MLLSLLYAAPVAAAIANQITVDVRQKFQKMDGFGASEAFQRANQIKGTFGPGPYISPDNRTKVLDWLFDPHKGAGLTILRNGIGSSPNNTADHMVSIEPVSPGSPHTKPHYVWTGDDNGQVWLSKEAYKRGVRTFYADAWSAPGYMKTNNTDDWGGRLCGVTNGHCETGDWRQAFANYLVQYLKFYKEEGITVTHIGHLNEPDISVSYASMLADGIQTKDFLEVLYPTLHREGFGNVKVAAGEATGWRQSGDILSDLVSTGGEQFYDFFTSHGYQDEPRLPFDTPKPVWQTEWADLSGGWTTDWDTFGQDGEGIQWANKIQEAIVISNCSAFLYWIGAENSGSNSPLIKINGTDIEVSKRLWGFAHFGRYVRPGAYRVSAESTNGVLHTSAYANADGSLTVLVINNGHYDAVTNFAVNGYKSFKKVTTWLTNNDHDITPGSARVGGRGSFEARIPQRSMMSFVIS
ncbi:glycoside hydrolase family 30 protein [Rhizodiscina lignyota]|uniref:Glycoside hydrolase family 30 protein n=1 Tax=Rhizodiscina lignyota TaxID=1504668 RepID=A0A9P4M0V9_9PEZI|nr:glycoside hydrolase family 30 protein [Rhizodiscina lignyota]